MSMACDTGGVTAERWRPKHGQMDIADDELDLVSILPVPVTRVPAAAIRSVTPPDPAGEAHRDAMVIEKRDGTCLYLVVAGTAHGEGTREAARELEHAVSVGAQGEGGEPPLMGTL
jgi:hypothetical protein